MAVIIVWMGCHQTKFSLKVGFDLSVTDGLIGPLKRCTPPNLEDRCPIKELYVGNLITRAPQWFHARFKSVTGEHRGPMFNNRKQREKR